MVMVKATAEQNLQQQKNLSQQLLLVHAMADMRVEHVVSRLGTGFEVVIYYLVGESNNNNNNKRANHTF